MATYTGKPAEINAGAQDLFDRFSDLTYFEERLKQLPPEQLAKVGDVKFTTDTIAINTPQVGELKFKVVERVAPERIVFAAESSPIPLTMAVNLRELAADRTEVSSAIEVEIPAMIRPLVGPKLQEAADKFSEMMSNLAR